MHMHGIPSTTLYIDPEEIAKAGRRVATIVMVAVGLSVVLPLVIGLVIWGSGRVKSSVKPFPAECAFGETVELSGDWSGTGPVIAKAEHGCKIHITNAKLKAPTLIKANTSNVEITLQNVTLETTDTAIQGDSNTKLHLLNTTITSSGDIAIKTGHNLEMDASASKITAKKAVLDTQANAKLAFKNATELSTDGVAIKTSSGLVLDVEGGKIDGGEGAIVATSGAKLTAKNVIFSSKTGETMKVTSSMTLDATDGAITSNGESAIECDGGDLSFAGTKVQGTTSAITGNNGLKLKATKKAAFVATGGDALVLTSNGNITLTDASLEGSRRGIKATVNTKLKPTQGARITGKNGGVSTGHNLEVDATNATIDGGTGPGIELEGANAKIQMQGGVLKGTPALKGTYKPQVLTLEGTRIEGEQQIPKR